MRVRVATFNAENLFARFKFASNLPPEQVERLLIEGWQAERMFFSPFDPAHRRLTAEAILGVRADIIGLQEIENLDTLKQFNERFLKPLGYRYPLLIDGNDTRGIDVALLSRFPFSYLQTHQYDSLADRPDEKLFSRDCLEAGIELPNGKILTVFVNHFKSMSGGARDETMGKRRAQATRVAQIVEARFDRPELAEFIVMGDLNDYMPSSGLEPLLARPYLENVLDRLPEHERWTHYYAFEESYHQLDYLLVSRKIAAANAAARPIVERRGMPLRAARVAVPRFVGVGEDRPKSSDHCPLAFEFEL